MDYQAILVDLDDGVATITLNRPEQMNAWNAAMARDLTRVMRWCDATDDVRVVVITGAGRAFCAGADLSGGGDTFSARRNVDPSEAEEQRVLPWHIRKPVIAAINGAAVGVGATFPMTCDVRFAAEDAKIGFVFVRRAMLPELSSHAVLPRIIGMSNAADLLLSGRIITGREAASMGLVSEALPTDEVLARAHERAHDIAINVAPVAAAASKHLLWHGLTMGIEDMREMEEPVFAWLADQADSREGVESFLEHRPPQWKLGVAGDFPAELLP